VGSVQETTRYIQNQSSNEAEKKGVQSMRVSGSNLLKAETLTLTKTSAMKL